MLLHQGEMISFMRTLIPTVLPNHYQVDKEFHVYGDDEDIKAGVNSYRNYLYHLYDIMLKDSTLSSTPKKGKMKAYDEVSLSVEYPFLNAIRSILNNIGTRGKFLKDENCIVIDNFSSLAIKTSLNKNSRVTLSNAQMLKALRILEKSGLLFHGIDLTTKRLIHDNTQKFNILFPEDSKMLIGLKALGSAYNKFSDRDNDDILFRCDYRFLGTNKPNPDEYLIDYTRQLSKNTTLFIHEIHRLLLDLGATCHTEMRMVNFHFMYTHKKKLLARFSASLNQGYRFIIKPKHVDKYRPLIDTFPDDLRETILKGYGCNKKSGTGHGNCQNGCAGIVFKLGDELHINKQYFKKWLQAEVLG